jgi:hypothetical protein
MLDADHNPVVIPTGYGICPCCKGSGRVLIEEGDAWMRTWKGGLSYYDPNTDTKVCQNCGGQTMYGKALGYTTIDPNTDPMQFMIDGLGCKHEYVGREAGRCYRIYTCRKCGHHYDIDSGD